MKKSILACLVFLVGCASSPVQVQKDMVADSVGQDRYIEESQPNLPGWATEIGIKDDLIVSVGFAEATADVSPMVLRRAAMMDAESQLFSKAPHEYREVVQHAMSTGGISGSQMTAIQTKLMRLTSVSGVQFPPDKTFCHKAIRDTGEFIKVTRVCYQQATVPIVSMNKTIEKTIEKYYPDGTAERVKKLMDDELANLQKEKSNDEAISRTSEPSSRLPSASVDRSREVSSEGP